MGSTSIIEGDVCSFVLGDLCIRSWFQLSLTTASLLMCCHPKDQIDGSGGFGHFRRESLGVETTSG